MKIDPRRDQSYGLESRLQALLHINLLARVTKALKVSENRPCMKIPIYIFLRIIGWEKAKMLIVY